MQQAAYQYLLSQLSLYNLCIAPEKIQQNLPIHYLGYLLNDTQIKPQRTSIRCYNLKTSNDFQRLLGDINCAHP